MATVRELNPSDENGLFKLDEDENQRAIAYAKTVGPKIALSTVSYPLHLVKTLIQLGHEPFPLQTGKSLAVSTFWQDAKFLPNGLSYARSLSHDVGIAGMYTGISAHLCSNLSGAFVTMAANIYIDRHFPNIGGKPENIDNDEKHMTDAESFRRMLRNAVRETITKSVSVTLARPFTVIVVRKIAQMITAESKYAGVMQSLLLIGNEEGIGGLFSGLVPQLIAEVIMIWGMHTLTFAFERMTINFVGDHTLERDAEIDEHDGDHVAAAAAFGRRELSRVMMSLVLTPIAYPFSLVSTMLAVTGSGLAISMLPYNPSFGSWQQCWQQLRVDNQLTRGAKFLHRTHTGAVTVGRNGKFYAATKHHVG